MSPTVPFPGCESGARELLLACYAAALAAVDGRAQVRQSLTGCGDEAPLWCIAVGKAAESMTLGALDAAAARLRGGLLVGKAPPSDPRPFAAQGIQCLEAGHPVPTEASLAAGRALLAAVARTPPDATLLFLLSGGASSLVEVPAPGVSLADLQWVNRWLLGSGLPIGTMNRIRTALSQIKGGGLMAQLPPRPIRALAISDVPGDDLAIVGSGLLVPTSGLAEALAALVLPERVRALVELGLAGRPEALPAGPRIEPIGTLGLATAAAAEAARAAGVDATLAPGFVDGDAAERGRELARRLIDGPSGVTVWGGETTVRLPLEPGRGGRNQHLALAAALELRGRSDCFLLAAGTDGDDGTTGDAGAVVDGGTLDRASLHGLDPLDCLARADSGSLLDASGDLIHTGPTGTNVMDLILGLKRPPAARADAGAPP